MAAAITLQTIFIYAGYGEQKNFFFKLSGLTFTLMILIASRFPQTTQIGVKSASSATTAQSRQESG